MSEPADNSADSPPYFRPGWFFAGLLAGMLFLAWAGHATAGRSHFRDYKRLHPAISPEGSYYPTVDELCALVRSRCRPDQVLVIVGGNSVFNGVGQPVQKLWTEELQRQLGDGFAVVNLAMRGASTTDGAAVVAEALRTEYPRQIYVANTSPFIEPGALGSETYRYLFWEAWYRGLLERTPARQAAVARHWGEVSGWAAWFETAGMAQVDRISAHRNLWNRVGMERIFTVPSFYTPRLPGLIAPRDRLQDTEPDFEQMAFDSPHRFSPDKLAREMEIVRAFSAQPCETDVTGAWRVRVDAENILRRGADEARPDSLKSRTLIVLSRNSPHYLQRLSAAERERDNLVYRSSIRIWQEAGYAATEYGADFSPEDYGDRTHLTASGGRRLALSLAPEIKALAGKLGYAGKVDP